MNTFKKLLIGVASLIIVLTFQNCSQSDTSQTNSNPSLIGNDDSNTNTDGETQTTTNLITKYLFVIDKSG